MTLSNKTPVYLSLPGDMVRRVNEYRRTLPEVPDRAKVMRELLDEILTIKGFPPTPK